MSKGGGPDAGSALPPSHVCGSVCVCVCSVTGTVCAVRSACSSWGGGVSGARGRHLSRPLLLHRWVWQPDPCWAAASTDRLLLLQEPAAGVGQVSVGQVQVRGVDLRQTGSAVVGPQDSEGPGLNGLFSPQSASLFKPASVPSSNAAGLRVQPSWSSPPPGSAPGPAPQDTLCMSTILEDPSPDSHLLQEALDEDFGRPTGSARQSFEDLTENVSGMKAGRDRQQRQRERRHAEDSPVNQQHLHRRSQWPRPHSSSSGRLQRLN